MEQVCQVFRLAVCQVLTTTDKPQNLLSAARLISAAVLNRAEIVVLPEMWNTPFTPSYFISHAEPPCGPSYEFMKLQAQTHKIYLVGGSIPVLRDEKIFNTSYVFDPAGSLIATYSKTHLFDIDIPGQIKSKESDTIGPGDSFVTFSTKWCKFGLGICYDVRFPLQALIYRKRGCKVLVYPAAFNLTTGPVHFEKLAVARA